MTGWAWFWMGLSWFNAAGWLWALRPKPATCCACRRYQMNGWDGVLDPDGIRHDPQRCQPHREAL